MVTETASYMRSKAGGRSYIRSLTRAGSNMRSPTGGSIIYGITDRSRVIYGFADRGKAIYRMDQMKNLSDAAFRTRMITRFEESQICSES